MRIGKIYVNLALAAWSAYDAVLYAGYLPDVTILCIAGFTSIYTAFKVLKDQQ